MTSQELVQQQRDLVALVDDEKFRAELAEVLPENVSVATFVRGFKNAALANPQILKADPASLYRALLRAGVDGLIADGREAAIVLHGDKATYMPMIGGIRKVLAEFGWSLRTAVIYENDTFEYDEAEAKIKHSRPRPGSPRGNPQGAYALAVHRDGRREAVVYDRDQILDVRKKSSRSGNVWEQWPDRMWEKTPAHRLAKKLPLASADRVRLEHLLEAEDLNGDQAADLLYGESDMRWEPVPDEADDTAMGADGITDEERAIARESTGDVERMAVTNESADTSEPVDGGESAEPSERTPPVEGDIKVGADDSESTVQAERAGKTESNEGDERQAEGGESNRADERVERRESAEASDRSSSPDEGEEKPFEGDEPPLRGPTFTYGRYLGYTLEDVYALGPEGVEYLRWAYSHWRTGPVVDALKAFAETHPEIKTTSQKAAKDSR